MAHIIKLTDGMNGRDTELVNVEDIKRVECCDDVKKSESRIIFKNGDHTYVRETPDEIYAIICPPSTLCACCKDAGSNCKCCTPPDFCSRCQNDGQHCDFCAPTATEQTEKQ